MGHQGYTAGHYADGVAVDDDADDDARKSDSTEANEAIAYLEKVSAILKRKYKTDRLILEKLSPKDREALDTAWYELVAS